MAPTAVDVSVVVGFKDWGVPRLELAVETLLASFGDLRGEVIVSDYGSTTCPDLAQRLAARGARHVFTPTDGTWSRSRALNAGFAASSGRVLVSTDADMLFSPRAMEVIGRRVAEDPEVALVLQCRNLPEGMGSAHVTEHGLQWQTYEHRATLRPRWGMGGMMAVARQAFLDVRGFDERMRIYGVEDLDFAQRVRRSGRRVEWLDDPEVRMYHMWHASSRGEAAGNGRGRSAVERNRSIYRDDPSYVRNTLTWAHRPPDAPPAASIAVLAGGSERLLRESVQSALAHTVADVEVIVVDRDGDGSAATTVGDIDDGRLRLLAAPGASPARAVGIAAYEARSPFLVLHDGESLMLPDRVEQHLARLGGGDTGTTGAWADVDDVSGSVVALHRGAVLSVAGECVAPGRSALMATMLRTETVRSLCLDDAAVDAPEDLMLRLARLGHRVRHTGHVHGLRLLRAGESTSSAAVVDPYRASVGELVPEARRDHVRALGGKRAGSRLVHGRDQIAQRVRRHLPDRLAKRTLLVVAPRGAGLSAELGIEDLIEVDDLAGPDSPGLLCGTVRSATWEAMADLRGRGAFFRVVADHDGDQAAPASGPRRLLGHAHTLAAHQLRSLPPTDAAVVVVRSAEGGPAIPPDAVLGRWRMADHLLTLAALPDAADALGAAETAGTAVIRLSSRSPRAKPPAEKTPEQKPARPQGTESAVEATTAAEGRSRRRLGLTRAVGRLPARSPRRSSGPAVPARPRR